MPTPVRPGLTAMRITVTIGDARRGCHSLNHGTTPSESVAAMLTSAQVSMSSALLPQYCKAFPIVPTVWAGGLVQQRLSTILQHYRAVDSLCARGG